MVTPELLDYLRQFTANGQSAEQAKQILMGTGWSEADINEGLRKLSSPTTAPVSTATPAPTLSVSAAPVQNFLKESPQPTHHFNKTLFSVIVVVLVLVAGGALAYFKPEVLGLSQPSSEEVLQTALTNTWEAKSSAYKFHLDLNYKGELPKGELPFGDLLGAGDGGDSEMAFSFDGEGESDVNNLSNIKSTLEGDLGLKLPGAPKVSVKFDTVFFGDTVYLKLNNVEDWGALVAPFIDVSSLGGKWIKINPAELMLAAPGFSKGEPPKSGELGAIMGGVTGMGSGFSPDQIQKMQEIFSKNKIFSVKEDLGDEEVNGEEVYHYRLGINQEGVKAAVKDYILFLQSVVMSQLGAELTEEEQKEMEADFLSGFDQGFVEVEKFFKEHVQVNSFDIWISKNKKETRQMDLGLKVSHPDLGGEVNLNMSASYSGFNEPVTIEEPKGALPFEEVMASFEGLGESFGFGGQSGDSKRISDVTNLMVAISFYMADAPNPRLCEAKNIVYASAPIKVPAGWKLGANAGVKKVNGTGWIPVNMNEVSGGAPIPEYFLDPENDPGKKLIYIFVCDPQLSSFEINARTVEDKYKAGMAEDGGDDPDVWEVGSAPGLRLIPKGFWEQISPLTTP